ncbi:MAG: histidine phosphatase family protein [Sneathiellaceae bacterium]
MTMEGGARIAGPHRVGCRRSRSIASQALGVLAAAGLAVLLLLPGARAAEPAVDLASLRAGGLVIYFRHAGTDFSSRDRIEAAGDWRSCDPARMRQLSDEGRAAAAAVGRAIRAAGIPVGRVVASEYCRSVETAERLDLGPVEAGTAIFNMRAREYVGGRASLVATARALLNTAPPAGTNMVAVAHGNLARAVLQVGLGEGDAAVLRPGMPDGPDLIGVLSPADWERFAADAR